MGRFSTDPDCIKQREYLNIPPWHKAGYLGQGLTVFCDDNSPDHRAIVADMIQTILPQAKVLTGIISNNVDHGAVTDCQVFCYETNETLSFDDFIKKHNVNMINNSTTGGKGAVILPEAVYMEEKIKEHNLVFCGAAGNGYGQPTTQQYNGACIVVASAVLENGKVRPGNCSAGENIDFAMFQGFAVGTSFASPFLLGMVGLLRCKYPGITQDEIYQYFKDHCQDIGEPGKDTRSGWGVPILGDPKTIIKMWPGKNIMTVDGNEVTLDQAPEIKTLTKRTLVPVRAISEAFGATVDWDEAKKEITIVR